VCNSTAASHHPPAFIATTPTTHANNRFSAFLNLFEPTSLTNSIGKQRLLLFTTVVFVAFCGELVLHNSNNDSSSFSSSLLLECWQAFLHQLHQSQFISLALFDIVMLSCTILDPMMDGAQRRGYYDQYYEDGNEMSTTTTATTNKGATTARIIQPLLPYVLVPILGPVAWILQRPSLWNESSKDRSRSTSMDK
jgi:hypothetical protein